jgi:hypothetical protein
MTFGDTENTDIRIEIIREMNVSQSNYKLLKG